MGNLQGIVIPIGDVVYHPRIDPIKIGFLIEEIIVRKHVGPSKHPSGTFKIIWSFGDISYLKGLEDQRERKYKNVMQRNCYPTVKDCVEWLESQRKLFITSQLDRREQALGEVVDLKQWLEEAKRESLQVSRLVTKKVAMLNQFDVERDLEKRGLINE